jgi:hypothetical protein
MSCTDSRLTPFVKRCRIPLRVQDEYALRNIKRTAKEPWELDRIVRAADHAIVNCVSQ